MLKIHAHTLLGTLFLCVLGVLIAVTTVLLDISPPPVFSYTTSDNKTELRLTRPDIEDSLENARQWFLRDMRATGFFIHQYDPRTGTYTKQYSMSRQMLAARLLAEESWGDTVLMDMHRKNFEYIFSNWYKEEDDKGYIFYNGDSLFSANGLALSAIARSPLFDEYRAKGDALAAGILASQKPTGELGILLIKNTAYDLEKERSASYYSGEIILGLFDWHERTKEERFLEAALAAQRFYLGKYASVEGYNPLLFHWHILSLTRAYALTRETEFRDGVYTLSDALVSLQKTEGVPSPLVGVFAPPGESGSAAFTGETATRARALVEASRAAHASGDDERAAKYREAAFLAIHQIIGLQYGSVSAERYPYPGLVEKGFANSYEDPRTRIDGTQQSIDALVSIVKII